MIVPFNGADTMDARPKSRLFTFQVTVSILALALAMSGLIAAFGLFAMLRADRGALARQAAFVERGLSEQLAALGREQESVAVWDDAVTFARAGDQTWMAENLTVWMADYYGHDRLVVLDERNRPVQSAVNGAIADLASFAEIEARLAPALAQIRRELSEPAWLVDGKKPSMTAIMDLPEGPALVGVSPLTPSSDRVSVEAGQEYLHVAVQRIDADLVARIAEQYQLSGMRVLGAAESADAAVAIAGPDGRLIGAIGWSPDRPGLSFVRETAPAMLAGAGLAIGLIWYLLKRLRRLSSLLQKSREEAEHLAAHDPLTGLPNRLLFERRLNEALAGAASGVGLALFYLDLDRFKQVNDTLGHAAGDRLIREAGERLRAAVRKSDTVARIGGDEFAIILTDCHNRSVAETVAETALNEIARPFTLGGESVSVGVSIGIAPVTDGPREAADLLREADHALYEAKRAGGDRYIVFAKAESRPAALTDEDPRRIWREATGLARLASA